MEIVILLVLLAVTLATDCSIDDDCEGDGACFICDVDFNYCRYDFDCCEHDAHCSGGYACVESQCKQKTYMNMKIGGFMAFVIVLPTGVIVGIICAIIFAIRKKLQDAQVRAVLSSTGVTPTSNKSVSFKKAEIKQTIYIKT
jgi:hypothetical protein